MLHRVDEIEQLPGPRFYSLCYRLTAYQGVIAAAYQRQRAARDVARTAEPMSLGEWARKNPGAMQAAHQRMTDGR